MPLREYQTFQYIMYKECLAKEEQRKAQEEAARVDAERQKQGNRKESIRQVAPDIPEEEREKILQRAIERRNDPENKNPLPEAIQNISLDDIEELIDDDL